MHQGEMGWLTLTLTWDVADQFTLHFSDAVLLLSSIAWTDGPLFVRIALFYHS